MTWVSYEFLFIYIYEMLQNFERVYSKSNETFGVV